MKRWIKLAAALYPARWRAEYGKEFDGVIDNVRPGWRTFANVLGGAMAMQIADRADWLKWMAATAAVGTALACGFSFATQPAMYASVAMLQVNPVPDPVRPAPPAVLRERAADRVADEQQYLLSRTSLKAMITAPAFDLYKDERSRESMETLVERMRRDIRFETLPAKDDAPGAIQFSVTFHYPDAAKARAVTEMLAAKIGEQNSVIIRSKAYMYRAFWDEQARRGSTKPVPPPPPMDKDLVVVSEPSQPDHADWQDRIGFIAIGTGVGGVLGLLFSMARRKRGGGWVLAGSATAGFLVAAAIALLIPIPVRYTSTAVLRVMPAMIAEDPMATPSASGAAALVGRLESKIAPPRGLRIALLPAAGVPGEAGAFSVSFTASDPQKAQDTVREIVTRFTEMNITENRARARNDLQQQIEDHKVGQNLEVLDPPSASEQAAVPNRAAIAGSGLALGLLIGMLALLRRPQAKLV